MEPAEYEALLAQEEEFWWYSGLRRLVEREVRRVLASGTGTGTGEPRILDAGCGTGGMTSRLSSFGRATGLDYSPLALSLARSRGDFRWTRGSVERLPFRSGTFDLIVSLDVLYHQAVASDRAGLREFRRCLRPGGALILNLPSYEAVRSSHDVAIHTARRYRRSRLIRLLREEDLTPVRVTYWNTFLFPALAAVRWWRRRSVHPAGPAVSSDVRQLPRPVNGILEAVLGLERAWLRGANLPFGLSVLAVARRPKSQE